jgi:hypothetical protein
VAAEHPLRSTRIESLPGARFKKNKLLAGDLKGSFCLKT